MRQSLFATAEWDYLLQLSQHNWDYITYCNNQWWCNRHEVIKYWGKLAFNCLCVQRSLCKARRNVLKWNHSGLKGVRPSLSQLVSWCFKPSQPQRITSGLHYHSLNSVATREEQEQRENFLLQSQLCVPTLIRCPFHPRVTAVARKRPWSVCQKCRWQVTPKHACT